MSLSVPTSAAHQPAPATDNGGPIARTSAASSPANGCWAWLTRRRGIDSGWQVMIRLWTWLLCCRFEADLLTNGFRQPFDHCHEFAQNRFDVCKTSFDPPVHVRNPSVGFRHP